MYEHENIFLANRYAGLFNLAERAIETQLAIKNLNEVDKKIMKIFYKLLPNDLPIVAASFAIQSIDQFINHLGFIFYDGWKDQENFHDQYKKVKDFLLKSGLETNDIITTFYPNFLLDRENVRHQIQHPRPSVHSGIHDLLSSKELRTHQEFAQAAVEFYDKWPNVNLEEAIKILNSCKKVIGGSVSIFKSSFITIDSPELKRAMFDHMLFAPFDENPLLTGGTSLT